MNTSAFPSLHPSDECRYQDLGMTLRDYFAAKAMQGMCASNEFSDSNYEDIARWAYSHADAMLKERENWKE